ncbi:hypothetical protein H1P_1520010 [Hyella patelloides LEGE 07179]|uniref:Uncharacterized protein n=1 Tax=Hyella patelloides LEGE 07179 TaxID=945734 RepID=A0A563VM60_9CYAN|nr:hypothetical protein [Hyella patelloides]VEP12536.1 hypothetical protein H1P_1520010 [Hyella patelloides LEGE 07179]
MPQLIWNTTYTKACTRQRNNQKNYSPPDNKTLNLAVLVALWDNELKTAIEIQ